MRFTVLLVIVPSCVLQHGVSTIHVHVHVLDCHPCRLHVHVFIISSTMYTTVHVHVHV